MSETLDFRPLVPADVPDALRIIRAHDSDDGAAAAKSYRATLDGHYALCVDDALVGVTGGYPVEGTDATWFLSWTYLDAAFRGRGLGRELLRRGLDALRRRGARKVFVTTSDLRDRSGELRYGAALRAYAAAGFEPEAEHADFYAPGETMLVMGMRLKARVDREQFPDPRALRFDSAEEIVETDDAWVLDWRFVEDGPGDGPDALAGEVARLRDEEEARVVFVSVPSDAPAAAALFEASGWRRDGALRDFYEDGVDEVRWRLDLSGA